MNTIPRAEYPNPQFERKNWMNLNGIWEFELDAGNNGRACEWYKNGDFTKKINVPFCMESKLSGLQIKEFVHAVWYRRTFEIPAEWKKGRVFLKFGAVDYHAYVYCNGSFAGDHQGGYTSFEVELTDYIIDGLNTLTVCAEDDTRNPDQPSGKQSDQYHSYKCMYTRTTGIWQTVWLEYVPHQYIKNVKYYPDLSNKMLYIKAEVFGDGMLRAKAFYNGIPEGEASAVSHHGSVMLSLPLANLHLWEPLCGRLYDLELSFGDDRVSSYFGMRQIALDGYKMLLNGKKVFQRTVLDQGFYPDGVYTAPDEADLINDIQIALDAGFNGARLHQKVFEPRFLYHCDKMGYLVWGEYGNWGFDHARSKSISTYLSEWREAVERDFNHPAIVGWIPFNETPDNQLPELISTVYDCTKLLDTTRPCIDASGWCHVKTDIFDVHNYLQDAVVLTKRLELLQQEGRLDFKSCGNYRGEPVFFSEYGGIKWKNGNYEGWGYGNVPATEQEFRERYQALTEMILKQERIFGFCYTQLYDVEQEINGLYTYDRKPKFDMAFFRKINIGNAAYETAEDSKC